MSITEKPPRNPEPFAPADTDEIRDKSRIELELDSIYIELSIYEAALRALAAEAASGIVPAQKRLLYEGPVLRTTINDLNDRARELTIALCPQV